MIGQNNFIALVRISSNSSNADFSKNHFELISTDSLNAKLSLIENCNVIKATPLENFGYYTVSESTLYKVPASFIGENKQFIFFITNDLVTKFRTFELYNIIDTYLISNNLATFWESSKLITFKNIKYKNYTLDPLDTITTNT